MQRIWHRKFDGWFYATVRHDGQQKQLKLHRGPNTPEQRVLAKKQLIKELAERLESHDEDAADRTPLWATVSHVITGFLVSSGQEHEKETTDWYTSLLAPFEKRFGRRKIRQIGKKEVMAFVCGRYTNTTSQNKAVGAIKRAFAWAVEEEHIHKSPIAHVRKPKARSRRRILETEERELIYRSIRDAAFRDYFTALCLTGCRPGEIARVTAAECRPDKGYWELPEHKTAKRTGEPRYASSIRIGIADVLSQI